MPSREVFMLLALVWMAVAVAACGPSMASSDECRAALLPGDLVITEVFADHKAEGAAGVDTGVDTGKEWFEIYNARGQPIDLAGLVITHSRPDGSRPNSHTVRGGTIAARQFFTLGSAAPGAVPAYIDYGYGTDLGDLSNSDGGKLSLSCGDREIDSAPYRDVKEGHSRELTGAQLPDYTINDDPDSWCQASGAEFETGNFGTPGSDNDCRPIVHGQCNDAGTMRSAVAPGPGDLVITELMPSPPRVADSVGEWFEASAITDVDLNGVGLGRVGATPEVITSPDCIHVRAGSHVVFARSADPALNGGIPAAAISATFRFNLVDAPGDVAIIAGTTVIDAVRWTRSPRGASLQLDPELVDPIANDTESNFCSATAPYGPPGTPMPDLGTPGADNAQCATLPDPHMCQDSTGVRPIVPPRPGQLVIDEILANPANVAGTTDATREWFEVANTGDAAFDLNELVVGRIGAAGAPVQSARCIAVPPRGLAVFARSADPALNGGLPAVQATFRFGLVDTSGDIQIAAGTTVLDTVRWTSVTSGVASQLDPGHLTPADNDDATRFCAASDAYGDQTNRGTPGAGNRSCR
jgi:hypothetical protein